MALRAGLAAMFTVTGILELAGAAGLLIARTVPWAAAGLSLMLIAMFPANVHLASYSDAWDDQLVPRTLLQLVFLAATVTVVRQSWPQHHPTTVAG